jgi:hypothetical protein
MSSSSSCLPGGASSTPSVPVCQGPGVVETKYKPWMDTLRGVRVVHITITYALELAQSVNDESEIIRLTKLKERGITFLDIEQALNPKPGVKLRGDRRSSVRDKDRRKSPRTPGRFKNAEDAYYEIARKRSGD